MNRNNFTKLLEGSARKKAAKVAGEVARKLGGKNRALAVIPGMGSVPKGKSLPKGGAAAAGGAGALALRPSAPAKGGMSTGGKIAAGLGGAAALGGLAFLRHRGKKAAAAAQAAKPLSQLKAAGGKVVGALKKNPKAALAAGATGLAGMMFMRKKDKKGKK